MAAIQSNRLQNRTSNNSASFPSPSNNGASHGKPGQPTAHLSAHTHQRAWYYITTLPDSSSIPWHESLSYDRRESANIAISAATSTLTLIFEEPDLRKAMTAVPIFTHTMVAFSATFLLKMAKTWGGMAQAPSPEWVANKEPVGLGLNFNINQVLSLARRSSSFLAKVAENLNEKHITRHIVEGLNDLLKRLDVAGTPSASGTQAFPASSPATTQVFDPVKAASASQDESVDPTNEYNMYDLIGSYGFGFDETFLGQVAPTNLDFWQTEPF
jgi:hypothetical protein